jgi:TIR domain-containing protein
MSRGKQPSFCARLPGTVGQFRFLSSCRAGYTSEGTAMPHKVPSVFLSYARSDRDLVQKIGQELSEAGLEVWDPDQKILPGANWTAELKAALDSAGALVVFISPDAMASRSVSYEIEYALSAKHLRGRVIPVTIRPTKNAPWILDSLQSVRYQSPGKTGRQIVELLGQTHNAPEAKSRTH